MPVEIENISLSGGHGDSKHGFVSIVGGPKRSQIEQIMKRSKTNSEGPRINPVHCYNNTEPNPGICNV